MKRFLQRRRLDLGAGLLLALVPLWLLRGHVLGTTTFLGNHDRANYALTQNLAELNTWQARGQASAWDGAAFLGYDLADLPAAPSPLSPMRAVARVASRGSFFYWAGLATLAVMLAAVGSAYLALRVLGLRPWTGAVGAVVYLCSASSLIRLAQSDTGGMLLVLLPLGVALLARADVLPDWSVLAGMFAILAGTLETSIGLLAAYLIAFLAAMTVVLAAATRRWRLVWCGAAAGAASLLVAWPRLWSVGRELALFARVRPGGITFAALYTFFNVRSWEILRWLDNGIFGRFPSEAAALGNNINLNEGFQLYSATFATLLVLGALVHFRGRWLGALRDGSVVTRLFAALVLVIPVLVCTRAGAHLLYELFLRASLLHARIVILAALPAAWLAAATLDHGWERATADRAPGARVWGEGLVALILAGAALGGIGWLGQRPGANLRLSWTEGPARLLGTAWRSAWSASEALTPPQSFAAVRVAPTVIALGWRSDDPGVDRFEIAMEHDGTTWPVIGSTKDYAYTVGGVAPGATYNFSVCAVAGARRSAPAYATATGQIRSAPVPFRSPIWLRAGSVVKISLCLAILVVIWVGARLLPPEHPGRRIAILLTGALLAGQALQDANFRLNGPQTFTRPHPFAGDNYFNAQPPLQLPTPAQMAAAHARLDPDHFRTVFLVDPRDFFGYPVPYVAEAWQLRVVEGYLSGVPARLAALPWPDGVRGFRTIAFRTSGQLPWALLGRLNVKYAVPLTASLYLARADDPASPAPALQAMENPEPVTPRAFFAARTIPVAAFSGDARQPLPVPGPEQVSTVEGDLSGRSWPTDGAIDARFAGDAVTVRVTPAAHERFLVLNEMYHPGWQATAAGRPLPVYATNTVMRGVVVPPDASEVDFRFRPWADAWWAWASRLAGCALLVLALLLARRRRRAGPTPA